jgi:hypothetical protein
MFEGADHLSFHDELLLRDRSTVRIEEKVAKSGEPPESGCDGGEIRFGSRSGLIRELSLGESLVSCKELKSLGRVAIRLYGRLVKRFVVERVISRWLSRTCVKNHWRL